MLFNLNRVCLIGHLGKDPHIRRDQNSKRFASFTLATNQSYKDRATGEERSYTQWHQISIASDGLSAYAEAHLKKGHKIYLEGQLEYRTYKDSTDREVTISEIVLRPAMRHFLQIMSTGKDGAAAPAETAGEDWSAMLDDSLPT